MSQLQDFRNFPFNEDKLESGESWAANCPSPLFPSYEFVQSPVSMSSQEIKEDMYTFSSSFDLSSTPERPLDRRREEAQGQQGSALLPSFNAPVVVAEKYLLLSPMNEKTFRGMSLHTHEPVIIKALSFQAARELTLKHALVVDFPGVRSPQEVITSPCGRMSYVVFPSHFGDLYRYSRWRWPGREAEVQRLFRQVTIILSKCHAEGLLLRDLKLRKFVFTDPSRETVALECLEDCLRVEDNDTLKDKNGCPAYVAPEILSNPEYSGRPADMWALGVMLFTMLVGRYPFSSDSTVGLFKKIRKGEYVIPDWLSSRARHLITSLLRMNPSERPSHESVLMHPWLTKPARDRSSRKDVLEHCVPDMSAHEDQDISESVRSQNRMRATRSHVLRSQSLRNSELEIWKYEHSSVNPMHL